MISDIIITVIFMIPLYGFFTWAYNCPEDCILFGKRWKYSEEPEVSPNAIRYIKFASIASMVGSPIVIFCTFLEKPFFDLALMAFILILAIGGIYNIYGGKAKS